MSLEEKYIAALGDMDCDEYTHRELCYYLVELVHENLCSKRALRELEQLLVEVAAAIREIRGE
jgi:cAMP phosphodiesterase